VVDYLVYEPTGSNLDLTRFLSNEALQTLGMIPIYVFILIYKEHVHYTCANNMINVQSACLITEKLHNLNEQDNI
jgi:hypothetical protein